MALEVILDQPQVYRILLECYPEGVFVNVFDSKDSSGPVQDHYQPDLKIAKQFCEDTFFVSSSAWREVPDEQWH